MIRALCTWSLKISAALYVRHFHILHTIDEAEVLNQKKDRGLSPVLLEM